VKADKALMDAMLKHSGGAREVPVIVQNGTLVDIGWGGFT
jgi:glutaredoxin